ncbi:unnamed protein product, partial [Prorocentrum cordatum]
PVPRGTRPHVRSTVAASRAPKRARASRVRRSRHHPPCSALWRPRGARGGAAEARPTSASDASQHGRQEGSRRKEKTDRTGGEAEGRGLYPWGRRTCEPPSIATKSSRRSDADVHGPSVRVGVDALDHRADLLQRAPPRRSPEPRARSWHRWIDATEP